MIFLNKTLNNLTCFKSRKFPRTRKVAKGFVTNSWLPFFLVKLQKLISEIEKLILNWQHKMQRQICRHLMSRSPDYNLFWYGFVPDITWESDASLFVFLMLVVSFFMHHLRMSAKGRTMYGPKWSLRCESSLRIELIRNPQHLFLC